MEFLPGNTSELIDMLGGTGELARALEVSPGAVSRWRRSNEVSPAQHAKLLALCVRHEIYWRPPGWPPCVQLRYVRPKQRR